jgi:hypothetical protein
MTKLGKKDEIPHSPTPILAANINEIAKRFDGRTINGIAGGGGPGHEELILHFENGGGAYVQVREDEEEHNGYRFGVEFFGE